MTTEAEGAGRAAVYDDGFDSSRSEHCRPKRPKDRPDDPKK